MPAALPANNTPRLVLHYTSAVYEHTLTLRFEDGSDPEAQASVAEALMDDLAPYSNAFVSAETIAAGADFSVPIALDFPTGTWAGAAYLEDPESAFISVTGRSDGGHKVRWELFTVCKLYDPWPLTNRVPVGETGIAATIVAAFEDACSSVSAPVRAIDGGQVTVHQYLNFAKSGYWQRAQRG